MSESEKARSVPRKGRGITVAASPFNPVKLDLGIILLLSVILLIVHPRLVDGMLPQLLLLFTYGLLAAAWLAWRIRRLSRQLSRNGEHG